MKKYKQRQYQWFVNINKKIENNIKCDEHDLIPKILKYWYLFDDNSLSKEDSHSLNSHDMVVRILEKKYLIRKRIGFTVQGGYVLKMFGVESEQVNIENVNESESYSFKKEISYPKEYCSAIVTLNIRNVLKMMSYFDFQFIYLWGSKEGFYNLDKPGFYSEGYISSSTYEWKRLRYLVNDLYISKVNSIVGTLKFPLFVLSEHLVVETGVTIRQDRYSYEQTYKYYYKQKWVTTSLDVILNKDYTSETLIQNETINQVNIFPLVAVKYLLPYGFSCALSISKHLQFYLSYHM